MSKADTSTVSVYFSLPHTPRCRTLHSKHIRQSPMARIADQMRILGQHPPGHRLRRRLPLLQPLPNLLLANRHAQLVRLGIDRHDIAVLHDGNRAPDRRFRHDVPDDEAMTGAAVPSVGDEGDVRQLGAHDGRRGLQLLRHAGPAFRAFVAHNQDEVLAARDLAFVQGAVELGFFVEDARLASEDGAFFAGDLGDGAAGGEVAFEDLQVARGFDRVGERADDDLVLGQGGEGGDVFGQRLAGYGGDVAVEQASGYEEFLHGGHAADVVEIRHVVSSRRCEVGDEWDFVAHALDVVEC